jgi:hypothetical protein
MKRKISHSNPDIVYLSLHLCETLVKNGKESFYLYINEESEDHFIPNFYFIFTLILTFIYFYHYYFKVL